MRDPYTLSGKTILITGASSGIGRAVAVLVARLGGSVVAVGRRAEMLAQLVAELGENRHGVVVADLTDPADRKALLEAVPPCDGLVHAAGLLKLLPFAFIQEKAMRESQAINYEAPVLLTKDLLRKKRISAGGAVVFISSVAASSGAMGHAIYSGTKGALEAAARCLALEVASQRIRVNCVAPGMVRTAMAEEAESSLGTEAMGKHEQEYPLGFGEPEDVAAPVAFLLSDDARWITGTTLTCDGGFTAK